MHLSVAKCVYIRDSALAVRPIDNALDLEDTLCSGHQVRTGAVDAKNGRLRQRFEYCFGLNAKRIGAVLLSLLRGRIRQDLGAKGFAP